jgi:hypothetical protein
MILLLLHAHYALLVFLQCLEVIRMLAIDILKFLLGFIDPAGFNLLLDVVLGLLRVTVELANILPHFLEIVRNLLPSCF